MKFTESHEWIEVIENIGTVGITEYAQRELGDVVYVELPKIEKKVKALQEVAVLESTKAAADIYSPVTGIILDVNDNLINQPELINKSPMKEGWLYKIKIENKDELDNLMNEEYYFSKFK